MFKRLLAFFGFKPSFTKRVAVTLGTFHAAKENLVNINEELAAHLTANEAKIAALTAQNALHTDLATQNGNVIANINALLNK